MLRECFRILRPRGLLAGYVIHTPRDLGPEEARRASELGPTDVLADAPPPDLLRAAGFEVLEHQDVTPAFQATCGAMLRGRVDLEDALRAEEGDERYAEECEKKSSMLLGMAHGLLLRSLTVAVSP